MSEKSLDWKKIWWAGKIFQHLLYAGEPRCLVACLHLLWGQLIWKVTGVLNAVSFRETVVRKKAFSSMNTIKGPSAY